HSPVPEQITAETKTAARHLSLTFNLETLLWLALLSAAFALRLARLDHLPLTIAESGRAFDAWLVAEGTVPESWSGDLTAAITSYLFRILGDGDVVARLLPAIAGCAALALLWQGRPYIGKGGALLAAIFFSFSPLLVHASRSVLPFSGGILLSLAMVFSFFAYLREPRAVFAVVFAIAAGLSLGNDPISITTLLALGLFLIADSSWQGVSNDRLPVGQAYHVFASKREHWLSATAGGLGAVVVSVTHFGTELDRLSLPGLKLWTEMFDLPHDSLPGYYSLGVLVAYEWPLLLMGASALFLAVVRWFKGRQPSAFQRFLLIWIALAALLAALTTRRESGQLISLLLPLGLLAGSYLESLIAGCNWSTIRRWWPALGDELALITYCLILLAMWARPERDITGDEKALLILAMLAVAALPVAIFIWDRQDATPLVLCTGAIVAVSFLVSSAFAIGWGNGSEFLRDSQTPAEFAHFKQQVTRLAEDKESVIGINPVLLDSLGWPMRKLPLIFGSPTEEVQLYLGSVDNNGANPTPAGFHPVGSPFVIGERWYPESFELTSLWRWLAYREAYGDVSKLEVQVYLREQ
ncbi:MAG TPA: glycosyltransferase family 39 protein, partial [Dehalococcoidia bacterium]|nr:glycosyltransferase family 39 protein [Dehalococcoidia bacterium]